MEFLIAWVYIFYFALLFLMAEDLPTHYQIVLAVKNDKHLILKTNKLNMANIKYHGAVIFKDMGNGILSGKYICPFNQFPLPETSKCTIPSPDFGMKILVMMPMEIY